MAALESPTLDIVIWGPKYVAAGLMQVTAHGQVMLKGNPVISITKRAVSYYI